MKIDVDEQNLSELLHGGSNIFSVPDYQRPYSWGISQLDDFWSDIIEIEDDDACFLGALVLIADTHKVGGFNILEVVDGQQRIATLSLLIDVLHNRYRELGDDETADTLEKYLYSSMLKRGRRIKLDLGKGDRTAYNELIEDKEQTNKDSVIAKNHNYFSNKIATLDGIELDKLLDKIAYKLSFVTIITDSHKSAYRLFETLNDRGLDLSAVDLIKNYLFKLSSHHPESFEVIKNSWEIIIENLDGIDKVRFFRQYIMSTSLYETRSKVTKERLYDRFIDLANNAGSKLEQLITDVRKQSELYGKLNNAEIDLFDESRNENINEHLKNISAIKATTSYTLLLRAFNEVKRAEDLIDLMKMIEVFSIRRSIVGSSTSIIDPLYNSLALDSFKQPDWKSYIKDIFIKNTPNDEEFISGFKTSIFQQSDQTKYVLDKLEIDGFGSGNQGKMVKNRFNVHIEHIAPQTMNNAENWAGFSILSTDEAKEKIMNIGNLTLLERKPNSKASNNKFEDKKKYYEERNKIDDELGTDMKMTHALLKYNSWGVNEIDNRAAELAGMAAIIWKL